MLSNFELEEYCKMQGIKLNYCGYKDTMKKRKVLSYNAIINLDGESPYDGNVAGSHWVCLIIKNKEAFYFDSFGFGCPIETSNFVTIQKLHHFGHNVKHIQHIKSERCGYYCVALLRYVEENYTNNLYDVVDGFMNMFDENTNNNEKILITYLKQRGIFA